MPNPRSIKRAIPPRYYPKYDDETRRKVERFLAAFLIDARRMVERSRVMAAHDVVGAGSKHQLDYWLAATSVARDMIRRVRNRQRHLMEITDEQIREVIAQCNRRSMI